MDKEIISSIILSILDNIVYVDFDIITEDNLKQDLQLDWDDTLDVLIKIENEFNIDFPDDVVYGLETVQDIIDYVYDELNQ